MLSINDGALHMAFGASNIYPFDYDKYLRILDGVLAEQGLDPSDVLAVSDEWSGLVAVSRTGVARGNQRGVFNKRVEVGKFVSFDQLDRALCEQRQPHGRESWLKLLGAGGDSVAEFAWHSGGPVEIEDAARERDRIFEAIMEAARPAPPIAATHGGPSISDFNSKRDFLLAWGHALVQAAGAPPTPEVVEEHARMAAGSIGMMVFLRLGAPRGIDDLNQYFPDGGLPSGNPLDAFDPSTRGSRRWRAAPTRSIR